MGAGERPQGSMGARGCSRKGPQGIASTMTTQKPGKTTLSWLLLILANILWACSYVAAKFALRDTSVLMMNALRMIIAALVLLPFLIAMRKDLKLTRRDLPQLALLAFVGLVINKTLE